MKGTAMVTLLLGVIVIGSPCTANQCGYKGGEAYAVALP